MSFKNLAPYLGILYFVALCSWTPHSRSLGPVKHTELQGRSIGNQSHLTAKRIYFPDYLTFSDSSYRGITTHLSKSLKIHGNDQNLRTHIRRGSGSLATSVTATDNYYVVRGKHLFLSSNGFPEGKVIIFFISHRLLIFRSMVVISDQMKKSVNHDPSKFHGELGSIEGGIVSHGVNTYEKISREDIALDIVKSDNVGKIVMSQILDVDIQDIRIGTKNYVNIAYSFGLRLSNESKPAVVSKFTLQIEINTL